MIARSKLEPLVRSSPQRLLTLNELSRLLKVGAVQWSTVVGVVLPGAQRLEVFLPHFPTHVIATSPAHHNQNHPSNQTP